jgi:hypothetical protein
MLNTVQTAKTIKYITAEAVVKTVTIANKKSDNILLL